MSEGKIIGMYTQGISQVIETIKLLSNQIKLKNEVRLITHIMFLKLGNDEGFCDLVGILNEEYNFDACCIWYPADSYMPPHIDHSNFTSNIILSISSFRIIKFNINFLVN